MTFMDSIGPRSLWTVRRSRSGVAVRGCVDAAIGTHRQTVP